MTTDRSDWIRTWVERAWQDVRYGCRMLAGSPGFTIVAVLSLAIGIGANCAIFSFADALLLRPLPVARPGEVLTVGSRSSVEALRRQFARVVVPRLRGHPRSQQELRRPRGVLVAHRRVCDDPAGDAQAQDGHAGERQPVPADGRRARRSAATFRPDEDQVPGPRRRRRARPDDVGAGIRLGSGRPRPHACGSTASTFTVIGVAPEPFTGMDQYVRSDFFVPLMMSPRLISDPKAGSLEARDVRNLPAQGTAQARRRRRRRRRAELTAIAADLERAYPGDEQEPQSLRADRAAGAHRAEIRRTRC